MEAAEKFGPLLGGKVVIVTGAAGLLGKAFSHAVARHGGRCVVADLDERRGRQVASEVAARFGEQSALFAPLDINDGASIDALIAAARARYGRIDAVVNSAYPRGNNYGRKFEDVELIDFCESLSLHVGGYFLVCQKLIAAFRAQGHGNIVNMASIYGFLAPRFDIYAGTAMTTPVEYAVIKSGILQLTRYLARYLAGDGIRVNAISPGGIADGQPEAFMHAYRSFCLNKGMLNEPDVCGALVFLISDLSKFVNGQNIVVDDGFSL